MGLSLLTVATMAASLWTASGCSGEPNTPPPGPPAPVVPSVPGPSPAADLVIAIDVAQRFQTIDGFGVSMRLFSDPHLILLPSLPENSLRIPASAQAQILDSLYSGIGLTRVRLGNDTRGIEPVNDNADPAVTDLTKFNFSGRNNDAFFPAIADIRARAKLVWWASPGQIETWMNESNPEEYVEWAMALNRRWRSQGMELPFYSIINEPAHDYSGGPWSGEYIRDVVKLLGRKLRAEGFATKLVVPDDLNAFHSFNRARIVLADPEARGYIGALAFHIYDNPFVGAPELKALARQYDLPLWMSEFYTASAFEWAEKVHDLLADYDVTAVDYLFGFFGKASEAQLVSVLNSGVNYTGFIVEPHFHVFGNYSRYVKPGAVRVGVSGARDDVRVSAFVRDGKLTMVAINSGSTSATTVRFDIIGLSSTRGFSVVRTLPENGVAERLKPLASLQVTANSITATLPPRSITTFFQ